MAFLFAACNSDEIPKETASDSQDSRDTDTDSNSNTNTDSNSNTESNSATESNSDTVPTGGDTDSDSNDTSASTPSTPSNPSESDTVPTDPSSAESNTITDSDPTQGTVTDTADTDTDSGGNVCEAPPAEPGNECETCLYDNCNAEYCACAADEKCLCVVNCLDGVTNSGNATGLDDLLGVDVDDLLGGLLDGLLGDLLDDLGQGDFDELGDVLECLSASPCGIPLDSLGGLGLDLDDLDNLQDILDGDNIDDFLEDLLEVAGNGLSPLLTCSELTNPGGECGTLCPIEDSLLD